MSGLEAIKFSLDNNAHITAEIKKDILELVIIFNNKFPNIKLDSLIKNLSTLHIKKISRFLNRDVSMYDCKNNILYINKEELTKEYDAKHIMMFELINMISSNGFQTGFNSDGKLEALSIGYTEILANYLVGNSGEKTLYTNEAIMANMIGIVVGNDKMFNSYFSNDSKILLNALVEAGVEL